MTEVVDQGEVARIAAGLTKAQRVAVYPGPGNPEYARGPIGSMRVLERSGVVTRIAQWTYSSGGRSAVLTPLGLAVRAHLKGQTDDQ